jgi:hypothetical protein
MTDTLSDKLRQMVARNDDELDALSEAADRIEELETALREIASGRYTGVVLPSHPPRDPAVERARAALGEEK